MADALGLTLCLGKITYSDSGTVNFTNFTIDGSTDECSIGFQAEEAITITRIGFRVNTITGTPGNLTASLQGIDTASFNPDGTIVGGGSPASVTVSAAGLTAGAFNWVTLDNPYTCTRGQEFSLHLDPSSGTWDGSNSIVVSIAVGGFGGRPGIPYALQAPSGTYAAVAGYPVYGYSSSTKVYGNPVSAVANTSYDSGSTPDEVGMAFTIPDTFFDTYKIRGVRLLIGRPASTGQTVVLRLYSGTSILQEKTVDSEHFGSASTNSGYRLCEWFFPESVLSTLNTGSVYRIVIVPQGTSGDVTIPEFSLAAAGDMTAYPLGESAYFTSRVDAGSFSDTTTKRLYMDLLLAEIAFTSGGGGSGTIIIKRGQSMDLRQSTAATVPFGRFLDTSGAPVTGLTIQKADVRIKKAGGDAAAASADQGTSDAGAPHDEDGVYDGSLNATDTNTVGPLSIFINETGAVPWEGHFNVLTAEEYDAKYSTGARRANVTQISGDATAADNAESFFDGTGYAGTNNVIPTVTNVTNLHASAATAANQTTILNRLGAWTGSARNTVLGAFQSLFRSDADASVPSDVNANLGSGAGTADNTTESLQAIKDDAATLAQVATEMQGVIEDNHLDHLLAVTYDPAAKPGAADALLNEIVESDAGVSRFTANALEQAPTGGGGGLDAAGVRAAIGMASANLDTQLSAIKSDTAATLEDTGTTLPATLSSMDAKLDTIDNFLDTEIASIISSLATIAGYLDTEIAAILADTNELQTDWANGGRLDLLIDAIKAVTDALPNAGSLTSLAQDSTVAKEATLTTTGRSDPAALGAALGSSLSPLAKLDWILARVMRENTFNKTTGEEHIKNAAGTNIAKATAADDGTTTTRGAFGAP